MYEALANNYIGEDTMYPTDIVNAVNIVCGNTKFCSFLLYYCGIPDDNLKLKFGYMK